MGNNQPTSLGKRRAEQMLRELAVEPFVAMVFTGGELKVYAKGLDDAAMRKVQDLIEELADE